MAAETAHVRALGYRVVREPGRAWPDALIIFPDASCADHADTLREVMLANDPFPNPKYRGK